MKKDKDKERDKAIEQYLIRSAQRKAIIRSVIDKDKNLNLKDLKRYCRAKYYCEWYDSVKDLWEIGYHKPLNYNCIDDLAIDIVNTTHKAVELASSQNTKRTATLFLSYQDDIVTDMYIENAHAIDDWETLFLFIQDGEAKERKSFLFWNNMTEEEFENRVNAMRQGDQPKTKKVKNKVQKIKQKN